MQHSIYPIIAGSTPYAYMFFSEGPKGKIRKGVFYTQIGKNLFNLPFGDFSEIFMNLNDFSRSNNGDRDKVLATVAHTAISFTDKFPAARIFVEGSVVQGLINKTWQPFQRDTNYEAFLAFRKLL